MLIVFKIFLHQVFNIIKHMTVSHHSENNKNTLNCNDCVCQNKYYTIRNTLYYKQ